MNTIDMSIHYLSDLAKFDDWFAGRGESSVKEEMVMRLLNVM